MALGDRMNYIRRDIKGILINDDLGNTIIESTLIKHINGLCIANLSTYLGRRDSISKFLGGKTNIPIYVDRNICLYPTKSVRCYDTVFVNFNEVLSVKKVEKGYTKFIFTNLDEIIIEVSFNVIMKQHKRISKILEYIENKN